MHTDRRPETVAQAVAGRAHPSCCVVGMVPPLDGAPYVLATVIGLAAVADDAGSGLPGSVSELSDAADRRRRLRACRLCVESDDSETRIRSWSLACDC